MAEYRIYDKEKFKRKGLKKTNYYNIAEFCRAAPFSRPHFSNVFAGRKTASRKFWDHIRKETGLTRHELLVSD